MLDTVSYGGYGQMKKFLGFCGNEPGRRPLGWRPTSNTDQDGSFMECSGRIFKEIDAEGVKLFGDIGVYDESGDQFLLRIASAIRKGQIESALLDTHGTWAFAAIDCHRKKVILGRDRGDSRQVYFAQVADGFVFGTRLLEVAKAAGAQEYNWDALASYAEIQSNIEIGERTPIEGVLRLPPGHYLVWENGSHKPIRWWDPLEHLPVVPKGIKRQSTELLRLLSCSLKRRVDATDGLIGVTVSGGMDSSSVFALLMQDRSLRERIRPYSITNPGHQLDEAPLVSDLMKMYQHSVEWIRGTMPQRDLYQALKAYLTIIEGPVSHPSLYLHCVIYDAIKKAGINNVMGGLGGDIAFAGHRSNQIAARNNLLKKKKYIAAFHAYEATYTRLWADNDRKEHTRLLKNFIEESGPVWTKPIALAIRHLRERSERRSAADKTHNSNDAIYARKLRALMPRLESEDFVVVNSTFTLGSPPEDFRDSILFSNLGAYQRIHEKVLVASGIEGHQPISDWEVLTFCLALPITSLVNRRTKYIMRYAMQDKLPPSILTNRYNVGIFGPVISWLNDPAVRSEITDMVNDRSFIECPLIEGEKFRNAWTKFSKIRLNSLKGCSALWKILCLFIWDRIIKDDLAS